MKTNAILVTTALFLGSGLVLAAEQQASPQPDADGTMSMESVSMEGMTGGCMPMHDHMDEMQAQIDAIYAATDPTERAELIETHMASMNEMMEKTRSMHSGDDKMDMSKMHDGDGKMDMSKMHDGDGKMDMSKMHDGDGMMDKDMDMADKKMGAMTKDQHEQHHPDSSKG